MLSTTTIPQLHLEHQLWINELNFYKEEIKLFEKYLTNCISSNPGRDAAVGVEHFQNQFIIQKDIIDHLKHELGVSENRLVGFVKELSGLGLDSIRMDNHTKLRERMKTFREIYSDLKKDFRRFESEWF
jgi:hypothetical protein